MLVIVAALAVTEFVGTVLEDRADAIHAARERANPNNASLAERPPSLTPESEP
jgi:hypothetical protein